MSLDNDFNWDERSKQPRRIGGKISNFIRGFKDLFPMLGMMLHNTWHIPGILSRYRYYKKAKITNTLPENCIGLAVTYDRQNIEKIIDAYNEINAGSLLIRILSWKRDLYPEIRDFLTRFGKDRNDVVITVLQDRESVTNLDVWCERLREIIELFSPLAEFFQIGHAPNRKKWGFEKPHEFVNLAKESLKLKNDEIKFIGPSAIDFEIQYLDEILNNIPSDCFDVINTLLYVDRRGMPENTQWPSFDIRNKIRIKRAITDKRGFEEKPFWITEVNWPLTETGKYSPAGRDVRVTEHEYASYLSRYFLLAFSTGIPERIFWWELCAPGYGLIDTRHGEFRKREGYYAFKTIASLLHGASNTAFFEKNSCYIVGFRTSEKTLFALWKTDGRISVNLIKKFDALITNTGEEKPVKDLPLTVSSSPLFVLYDGEVQIEEAFEIQS